MFRTIIGVREVESLPVKCIQVNSPNRLYLAGKSYIPTHNTTMLNFLTLIRCLKEDDAKAAIFSPENYPPTDFYMDMVHTILGRIPTGDDEEEVNKWLEVLNNKIYFVYPKDVDFTPENLFKTIANFIEYSGVNICILDPYLKLHHKLDGLLEHQYIGVFMSKLEAFTRRHNLSMHLVAHQLTPKLTEDGNRPKPSGYTVKGGGSFYDGTDNMLMIWRPNYEKDKNDPSVVFASSKIKKHKIVSKPNSINISFNVDKNRYISQNGLDMFDLAMGNELGF